MSWIKHRIASPSSTQLHWDTLSQICHFCTQLYNRVLAGPYVLKCQYLHRKLSFFFFLLKAWTEMNKIIFILSIAQTFVSGVTGSGGLTLQPERKGVFWDNIYRWYVSVFIQFKQLCHYCNLKPYLWSRGSLAWWKNDFFFQGRKSFLPCACAAGLGKGEGTK